MDQVASFFGVSPTTVRRDWKNQGMPGGSGKYPLGEIAQWRHDRLQRQTQSSENSDVARQLETAQALDKTSAAKIRHLKLQQLQGELISRAEAVAEIEEIFHNIRSRLEQVPAQVATSVPPDLRPDVIADWKQKIHLILKGLESLSLADDD